MAYRASRQASTKHSPYFMLFQQQMRLPIDSEMLPPVTDEENENLETTIHALIESRKQVFQKAESCITLAQENQKKSYNQKHQPAEIPVGTQVLLENTAQKQRKGGKLEPMWLGPYTISQCIGKGLYELCRDGKIIKKKANSAHLKVYKKRSYESIETAIGSDMNKTSLTQTQVSHSNIMFTIILCTKIISYLLYGVKQFYSSSYNTFDFKNRKRGQRIQY